MPELVFSCHHCGAAVSVAAGGKVSKLASCDRCSWDLHCCKNCRFYDLAKHNECAEPMAEWVRDKEKNNYCDYFEPRAGLRAGGGALGDDQARKKFDQLFKK